MKGKSKTSVECSGMITIMPYSVGFYWMLVIAYIDEL